MIAVVKIGGHQAIVTEGEKLEVDKLNVEVGKKVDLETLLVSEEDGKNFKIGAPILSDTKVTAKVLEHGRGDKIRVFKMKPRKRYRRTQGHRQDYTIIEITKIGGAVTKKTTPKPKAEEKKAETPKKTSTKKADKE